MGEVYKTAWIGPSVRDRIQLSDNEVEKASVQTSDLLFCRTSLVPEGVGIPAIVSQLDEPTTFASNLIRARVDFSKADPTFLLYHFLSPLGRSSMVEIARGTSVTTVTGTDIVNICLKLPPLPEQHAIAGILGALDDKIDLNRRMNETLEAMARALFKSWFVDFDPVRAKMEGRQPFGMDQATADLFPDRLVESEIGLIPEGWEVRLLDDVAEIVDCLHSKKPAEQSAGPTLLQVWNVGKNGRIDLSKRYKITDDDYAIWSKRFEVMGGDLVITKTGRVGAVGRMQHGATAAMGRNMVGLRASVPITKEFLAEYLVSPLARSEINRNTNEGTILASLHVKAIKVLRCVVPGQGILRVASNQINSFHRFQDSLDNESRTLAELRDLLLPKLLSGEIRVKDAEHMVEEAV